MYQLTTGSDLVSIGDCNKVTDGRLDPVASSDAGICNHEYEYHYCVYCKSLVISFSQTQKVELILLLTYV